MATKVFISWSGPLTQKIAQELDGWIPKVLQSVQTYFTPEDIEKGARWSGSIETELSQSEIGILCLTQENQISPWITFEAGALSKNKDISKVCPLLFNFDNTDLTGPLAIFQTTKFEKIEFKKLVASINSACSDQKLDDKTFDETFEVWWPKLEEKVSLILSEEEVSTKPQKRDQRAILEEILEIVRSNSNLSLNSTYKDTIGEVVDSAMILHDRIVRSREMMYPELRQLEYAIRRLCYDTGNVDLYHRISSQVSKDRFLRGSRVEKNIGFRGEGSTEKDTL